MVFGGKVLVYVYKCNITDPIKKGVKEVKKLMFERDREEKSFFLLPLEVVGIERQGKKEKEPTRNNTKRRASWRK